MDKGKGKVTERAAKFCSGSAITCPWRSGCSSKGSLSFKEPSFPASILSTTVFVQGPSINLPSGVTDDETEALNQGREWDACNQRLNEHLRTFLKTKSLTVLLSPTVVEDSSDFYGKEAQINPLTVVEEPPLDSPRAIRIVEVTENVG